MLPENPLKPYGAALEEYRGTGRLTLSTAHTVECEFAAGQLETGKPILLCATPKCLIEHRMGLATVASFEGTTTEGYAVTVDRVVSETNYLAEAPLPGVYTAIRAGHLRVCRGNGHAGHDLAFLLTNLSGIHAEVSFAYRGLNFSAEPIADYFANLKRLEVTRGVLPTVVLRATISTSIEQAAAAVDELCYLLSIALGTKIQWIALTELNRAGQWVCKHHYSRVTKRYGALRALDPRASGVANLLRRSGESGFEESRQRFGLTDPVVDTYLDAKSEGDFLQVRALKLVVAVEMLKAEFSDRSGVDPLILPADTFDDLLPELKGAIRSVLGGVSTSEQRKAVYAGLNGLNRTPFSWQLRGLCEAVRLSVSASDLKRFVASRNKLVHEGNFYCERATDEERGRISPLVSVQAEWFWLLHFVDRLFLRAIGYEGPYLDWSIPSEPVTRELTPTAVTETAPATPIDSSSP